KPGSPQQVRQQALERFNDTVESRLSTDLLRPKGTAEGTDTGIFIDDINMREQTLLFRQLLFGNGSRSLSPAEKEMPEWKEQFQKYLQFIEGRTRGADESNEEFFYRQSQLWSGVLMASPPGSARDRALQQYSSFLMANAA